MRTESYSFGSDRMTAFMGCNVFTATHEDPIMDAFVVLEGPTIRRVGRRTSAEKTPANAAVFDLGGAWLVPGLWDAHAHLALRLPGVQHLEEEEPESRIAIRAGRNLWTAFHRGITSLRVLGEARYVDLAWKQAIESQEVHGPRLFVAGPALTSPKGHGILSGVAVVVSGVSEVATTVRSLCKRGVDVIKLMLSGGLGTTEAAFDEIAMPLDEASAAVDVAHELGRRVAAHAAGPKSVKAAVRLGVDTVEHGYHLDDEAVDLMLENTTWYVPTLHVTQRQAAAYAHHNPTARQRILAAKEEHMRSARQAFEAGVRIAAGRDCADLGDEVSAEAEHLVQMGMSPAEAIIASTRSAAELVGAQNIGTIEVGKEADMLAIRDNPLEDITALRDPVVVVKSGNIYPACGSSADALRSATAVAAGLLRGLPQQFRGMGRAPAP